MVPETLPRTATIVIIGDEILSGEVRDENAGFLAGGLSALGVEVEAIQVVPDRIDAIVQALRAALDASELVVVSGGIGPTHDDLTREAVAEVMGCPCTRHAEAEERLRAGYGPSVTAAELAMADLPEGARLLYGKRTGTIGFGVGRLHVLPGVPHLLRDIFENLADGWQASRVYREEVRTDLREGWLADGLRELARAHPEVSIGSYPYRTPQGYAVRIVLRSRHRPALDEVERQVLALVESCESAQGRHP